MGQTTFSGPLRVGPIREGAAANIGYAVLTQTDVIVYDDTLVQDVTFSLPANSQIIDVVFDVLTQYDSATSATGTLGTSSGDTTYADGVNVKTGVRVRPTFTAANLVQMSSIGDTTDVVATVTSVGQPTAGQVRVTLVYAQKS